MLRTQGDRAFRFIFCFFLAIFLFPQSASAQNAAPLQYKFQPNQILRYRLDLQEEIKMVGAVGQELPVTTKTTIQTVIRMVESDSRGVATLEARSEEFSIRTTVGSKEVRAPASTVGQTVRFRVGPSGLLTGQKALSGSSGLPWGLFLSQVFPDLSRCQYLGPAVFNVGSCAQIGFDVIAPPLTRTEKSGVVQTKNYNQGKGTGLFADGHLISGETQGSVDLGYNVFSPENSGAPVKISVRGTFSSRLFLLP